MNEIMTVAIDQRVAAEKVVGHDDDPSAPCTFLMRLLRNQVSHPASITDREINSHTFGNITAGEQLCHKNTYQPIQVGSRGADFQQVVTQQQPRCERFSTF